MESRFKTILEKVRIETQEEDLVQIQLTLPEWSILNNLLFEVYNYYAEQLTEDKKYDRFFATFNSLYDKVNNSENMIAACN
jgi:hypothetical protein